MYLVVFRNRKRADIDQAAYEAQAQAMEALARQQPGFHAVSLITSNDCTDCHNAGEPPTPIMNHSLVVDNGDCVDCHYGYPGETRDPADGNAIRGSAHSSGDNCLGCHF